VTTRVECTARLRTRGHGPIETLWSRSHWWAGLALVGALVVGFALPASADDPHFDPGAGLPTVGPFSDITLNGLEQLTTATISPFVIVDDSATLNGWNVELTIPTFSNGTGADCTTDATATIDTTGLSMAAPLVAAADVDTSMTGVTSEGFIDFTTARKIVVANAGHGDGRYVVTPALLKLPIPNNVMPGAYCTTANMTITNGP
jgi:hypothetical protein